MVSKNNRSGKAISSIFFSFLQLLRNVEHLLIEQITQSCKFFRFLFVHLRFKMAPGVFEGIHVGITNYMTQPCMGFGNKIAPGVFDGILRAEHESGFN